MTVEDAVVCKVRASAIAHLLSRAIGHLLEVPQAIETSLDHAKFLASAAKRELVDFVLALNKSCSGRRKGKVDARGSTRIVGILRRIRDKAYKVPASSGSRRRFGDAAFRELHVWLVSEAPSFVRDLTTSEKVDELAAYLSRSFGDPQRLDYGTAHETLFVIFLLCLVRVGAVPVEEVSNGGLALVACAEYFTCCRAVQTQYGLEPAGSRGVWSLDDYQCLSFLFGSAQHSSSSAKANYIDGNDLAAPTPDEPDSLFFDNLRYAARSKTGASFAETSPILFSLANKSWGQVNRHILLYYERQVNNRCVYSYDIGPLAACRCWGNLWLHGTCSLAPYSPPPGDVNLGSLHCLRRLEPLVSRAQTTMTECQREQTSLDKDGINEYQCTLCRLDSTVHKMCW